MTTDYYMPYTEVPKAYPTPLEMVKEYYKTAEITPDPRTCLGLILEEQKEFWEEVSNKTMAVVTPQISYNPEDELKELADLVFVIYGYALSRGWDLDEAFSRVYQNNLGRMKQPDGTIERDSNGKILKNLEYPKVDLSDLVK